MRNGLRYALIALMFVFAMRPQIALARSIIDKIDQKLFSRSPELAAAYEAYDDGKFEEALHGFQAYANTHSSAPEHLYNAGVAAYQAGKSEEAVKFFEQSIPEAKPEIKAAALANEALIDIERKDLEAAEVKLKNAIAFDNDNKDIQENLAWVEEQLGKKPPEQKQDQNKNQQKQDQQQNATDQKQQDQQQNAQDQKQDQQQNAPDQKQQQNAQQKPDQGQQQPAQDQKQQGQQGQDQKSASQTQKDQKDQQGHKGQDQKTAEESKAQEQKAQEQQQAGQGQKSEPDKSKEAQQQTAQAAGEKTGDDKKKSGEQPKAQYGVMDKNQPNDKDKGQPKADGYLTQEDLKQQEAERLLRSVDDKIGRYPLTDTEATGKRGNDGKNW